MIGSNGPRMLALTLPYVSAWNSWYTDFDNDPGESPAGRDDRRSLRRGRSPPEEVAKTVALYIGFGGPAVDGPEADRLHGNSDDIVDQLRQIEAAGVSHVQAVLDPIVPDTIEKLGDDWASER